MKTKEAFFAFVLLWSIVTFNSCAQNEMLNSTNSDLTQSKLAIPLDERAMFDLIELTSFDSSKTWEDLDIIYKEQIALTDSRDLKSNAYIAMVVRKSLIEKADIHSLQYYAIELEKIDFNINLSTIVALINRLSSVWGKEKTIEYAKSMYDKNITYWNEHFSGKSSYLIRNEAALDDLRTLYSN